MAPSRRTFIKNTAITTAGLSLIPGCITAPSGRKIGVQLYTVRDLMAKDPKTTLRTVANIGYNQIETAGYADGKIYGMNPMEFRSLIHDVGIEFVSGHMSLEVFQKGFEQALEFMYDVGQKYAVLPWLNPQDRVTLDQFKAYAQLLNETAAKARVAGVQVCYHNHDFEFIPIDGELPMDILLRETDPNLVQFELDLYWISKIELDPVEFFKQNSGRTSLWHVKDMDNTPEKGFAEVGTGILDFKRIFNNEGVSGMKYFFVEQDQSDDPMKSIATSYKNLTESILA